MRRIGGLHWINAIEGANKIPWWRWCSWGELCWCSTEFSFYSYGRKSMGREFFFLSNSNRGKAVDLTWSLFKTWSHICNHRGYPVKDPFLIFVGCTPWGSFKLQEFICGRVLQGQKMEPKAIYSHFYTIHFSHPRSEQKPFLGHVVHTLDDL